MLALKWILFIFTPLQFYNTWLGVFFLLFFCWNPIFLSTIFIYVFMSEMLHLPFVCWISFLCHYFMLCLWIQAIYVNMAQYYETRKIRFFEVSPIFFFFETFYAHVIYVNTKCIMGCYPIRMPIVQFVIRGVVYFMVWRFPTFVYISFHT